MSNPQKESRSIHDNNIYGYAVLCEQRRIILHTEFNNGTTDEFTDVTFCGLIAHFFQNVLAGNILFEVVEIDAQNIVRQWSDLFERGKDYGWPGQIEYKDSGDLLAVLRKRSVKGFEIISTYGLSGWVLPEKMDVCDRSAKATH